MSELWYINLHQILFLIYDLTFFIGSGYQKLYRLVLKNVFAATNLLCRHAFGVYQGLEPK